jgi:hypothetical protein
MQRSPGLDHFAVRGAREPDDAGDAARVGGGEDDAGGLDGHVGAGADRDTHVGSGQRRGVVDAVADHRDGHRPGISGDHDDLLHTLGTQLRDGLAGLRPHLVFEGERAEHPGRLVAVEQVEQVQHRGAAAGPALGRPA